jgi:hypothetical protein
MKPSATRHQEVGHLPIDHDAVTEEGRYLFESLFKEAPTQFILDQYHRASTLLPVDEDEVSVNLATIVNRGLDPEAIEFALRRRKNSLTRKLRTLTYLAEVDDRHLHRFLGHETNRLRAWCALLTHLPRSGYKLVKGKVLLARYSVAG